MPTRREAIAAAAAAAGVLPVLGQDKDAGKEKHAGHFEQDKQDEFRPEPSVFNKTEFAVLAQLTELIIPRTDTPGAIDAHVPYWLDAVVSGKDDPRAGLLKKGAKATGQAARQKYKRPFLELNEQEQIALIEPWSRETRGAQGQFFRLVKDLTIDLYYTSRAGLVRELGYHGSTALASFPGCTHPEHKA